MIRRYLPQSIEELIRWYERYISPVSLLIGFSIDAVAVHVLDLFLYSSVLLAHLALAGCGILLYHAIESGGWRRPFLPALAPFVPVAIQFSFGALLSGFLLLYSRSAAISASWIFVVIIAALLIGNERFRRFYSAFHVQVGIFYFLLFSFLIFCFPIFLSSVGPLVFIASGATSIIVMVALLALAWRFLNTVPAESRRQSARAVAAVFLTINALYFLDAIPPLPLALRDAGVFHSVQRIENRYEVTFEPKAWYEFFSHYRTVYHRAPGEPVFVFVSVFAPSGIDVSIRHVWQRYDDADGRWITQGTYGYEMRGGRDGGYRGYTLKNDVESGEWRVNVETAFGQVIGRIRFSVLDVDSPLRLIRAIK